MADLHNTVKPNQRLKYDTIERETKTEKNAQNMHMTTS